jgi:hypothetical protein
MISKVKTMEMIDSRSVAYFITLGGIATFLPFIVHHQWTTGPIINAVLILSVYLLGIRSAVFIALFPSLMALSGGLLPAVLAPVVPFIMIGNIILIFLIDAGRRYIGFSAGLFLGSLFKFLFLYSSVAWIENLLLKSEFASKVALMMSWPQFATAIIGGILAWGVIKAMGEDQYSKT